MAVCSDMLESILGPIHSTCKPSDGAKQSISEDAETDRAKNGKFVILCSHIGKNEMVDVQNLMYLAAPISWDSFSFCEFLNWSVDSVSVIYSPPLTLLRAGLFVSFSTFKDRVHGFM
jgi:hypothetical protein